MKRKAAARLLGILQGRIQNRNPAAAAATAAVIPAFIAAAPTAWRTLLITGRVKAPEIGMKAQSAPSRKRRFFNSPGGGAYRLPDTVSVSLVPGAGGFPPAAIVF